MKRWLLMIIGTLPALVNAACQDGYWGQFQVDMPSGNYMIYGPVFSFVTDDYFMTFTTMTNAYRVQLVDMVSFVTVESKGMCGFAGEYNGDPIFTEGFELPTSLP